MTNIDDLVTRVDEILTSDVIEDFLTDKKKESSGGVDSAPADREPSPTEERGKQEETRKPTAWKRVEGHATSSESESRRSLLGEAKEPPEKLPRWSRPPSIRTNGSPVAVEVTVPNGLLDHRAPESTGGSGDTPAVPDSTRPADGADTVPVPEKSAPVQRPRSASTVARLASISEENAPLNRRRRMSAMQRRLTLTSSLPASDIAGATELPSASFRSEDHWKNLFERDYGRQAEGSDPILKSQQAGWSYRHRHRFYGGLCRRWTDFPPNNKRFDTVEKEPYSFTADERYLILGETVKKRNRMEGWIRFYDAATLTATGVIKAHFSTVDALEIRGNLLVSGSHDGTLRLWNVSDCLGGASGGGRGTAVDIDTGSSVLSACLGSGNRNVAAGLLDGRFCTWDVETGAEIRSVRAEGGPVNSVCRRTGHPSAFLVGCDDGRVAMYDVSVPNSMPVRKFRGHEKAVYEVFSDGVAVVSASEDGTVERWDAGMERSVRTLKKSTGKSNDSPYRCVKMHSGRVAAGNQDSTVVVWDDDTGKVIRVLTGHAAEVEKIFLDSNRVITLSFDDTLRVWQFVGESDAEEGLGAIPCEMCDGAGRLELEPQPDDATGYRPFFCGEHCKNAYVESVYDRAQE